HGVNMSTLADLNNLDRPYRLRVGQVLELPQKGGKPTAVVAQTPKETPPPVPTTKSTPPTGVVGTERYVVRRGDTLGKIAKRYGLSEDQLMEMNNIRNRQFIYEGQVLALAPSARAKPPVESEVSVATVAAVSPPLSEADADEPVSEREAEEIGP